MTNYQQLLTDLERELQGIQVERTRIEKKESALKTTINGIKQLLEITTSISMTPSQSPGTPLVPPYMFKDSGIVEAGRRYLALVGRPQKHRPMVDAIIAHGMTSNARDPYITFRSVWMRAMKDHGTFTYNDKKEWGLPEWKESDSSTD